VVKIELTKTKVPKVDKENILNESGSVENTDFFNQFQKKSQEMPLLKRVGQWFKNLMFFEALAIVFILVGIFVIVMVFTIANMDTFLGQGILDYSEFIGGLVGSLWSLSSVFLFYASLSSQKEELEEQKILLVQQISEVIKQTDEFRKQNLMAKEQKDEETFFQLLRFHNEIISSIELDSSEMDFSTGKTVVKTISGRRAFVEYYSIYKRFFQEAADTLMLGEMSTEIMQKVVDNSYNQFYEEYQADMGHYFRNLYNILRFIDNISEEENSKFYLSLLFAQLSNFELALIFFHGLLTANSDYKEIIEKYGLLSTVPRDELTTLTYKVYSESAFGPNGFGSTDDYGMGGMDFGAGDDSDFGDNPFADTSLDDMFGGSGLSNKSENTMPSMGSLDDIRAKLKGENFGGDNFDLDASTSLDSLKSRIGNLKKEADGDNEVEESPIEPENDVATPNLDNLGSLKDKLSKLKKSNNDDYGSDYDLKGYDDYGSGSDDKGSTFSLAGDDIAIENDPILEIPNETEEDKQLLSLKDKLKGLKKGNTTQKEDDYNDSLKKEEETENGFLLNLPEDDGNSNSAMPGLLKGLMSMTNDDVKPLTDDQYESLFLADINEDDFEDFDGEYESYEGIQFGKNLDFGLDSGALEDGNKSSEVSDLLKSAISKRGKEESSEKDLSGLSKLKNDIKKRSEEDEHFNTDAFLSISGIDEGLDSIMSNIKSDIDNNKSSEYIAPINEEIHIEMYNSLNKENLQKMTEERQEEIEIEEELDGLDIDKEFGLNYDEEDYKEFGLNEETDSDEDAIKNELEEYEVGLEEESAFELGSMDRLELGEELEGLDIDKEFGLNYDEEDYKEFGLNEETDSDEDAIKNELEEYEVGLEEESAFELGSVDRLELGEELEGLDIDKEFGLNYDEEDYKEFGLNEETDSDEDAIKNELEEYEVGLEEESAFDLGGMDRLELDDEGHQQEEKHENTDTNEEEKLEHTKKLQAKGKGFLNVMKKENPNKKT